MTGAARLLPGKPVGHPEVRHLDLSGAVTVTAGLGLLILGLTRIEQDGFTAASTLVLLAGSIVLLAAFVLIERRGPEPLVRFGLFRIPGVAAANLVFVAVTAVVASGRSRWTKEWSRLSSR